MRRLFSLLSFVILLFTKCSTPDKAPDDMFTYASAHKKDLRLSVFITTQAVNQFLSTEEGRREAVSLMRANGITKAYLEVYRSTVAPPELLRTASDYLKKEGFEIAGGIATVPGPDFGVRQEARFSWFNFQNPKTQNDLRKVMEDAAPIFDNFIVDDFLATSDTSVESAEAKGSRTWPAYRRDLLSELSKTIFIDPVKKINPKMNLIIKYPQWYDRYHVFGYDVVREPELFDQVWVGTESRGQDTKSFGFVQSYESFIAYRWLASLSGDKIGGAWFDHIDCDQNDFIDQAYQSVLAGAKELVIFNYYNLTEGHPGQHLLRLQFPQLIELSKAVAGKPVHGVAGYKPPHSDGGGNLYIMDYIGMLGIPLVPYSSYPANEKVIFLPAQAAADSSVYNKLIASLDNGSRIIMTTGFLASLPERDELARRAGITGHIKVASMKAQDIIVNGQQQKLELPLALDAQITLGEGTTLLEAVVGNNKIPYLTKNKEGNIVVINAHTFSDKDFEAVNELLLCPEPLALVHLPREWANVIRQAFNEPFSLTAEADARVAIQPFGNDEWMIQNYNAEESIVKLSTTKTGTVVDVLTGEKLPVANGWLDIKLSPRGKVWIK
jgi:hypothetical protein